MTVQTYSFSMSNLSETCPILDSVYNSVGLTNPLPKGADHVGKRLSSEEVENFFPTVESEISNLPNNFLRGRKNYTKIGVRGDGSCGAWCFIEHLSRLYNIRHFTLDSFYAIINKRYKKQLKVGDYLEDVQLGYLANVLCLNLVIFTDERVAIYNNKGFGTCMVFYKNEHFDLIVKQNTRNGPAKSEQGKKHSHQYFRFLLDAQRMRDIPELYALPSKTTKSLQKAYNDSYDFRLSMDLTSPRLMSDKHTRLEDKYKGLGLPLGSMVGKERTKPSEEVRILKDLLGAMKDRLRESLKETEEAEAQLFKEKEAHAKTKALLKSHSEGGSSVKETLHEITSTQKEILGILQKSNIEVCYSTEKSDCRAADESLLQEEYGDRPLSSDDQDSVELKPKVFETPDDTDLLDSELEDRNMELIISGELDEIVYVTSARGRKYALNNAQLAEYRDFYPLLKGGFCYSFGDSEIAKTANLKGTLEGQEVTVENFSCLIETFNEMSTVIQEHADAYLLGGYESKNEFLKSLGDYFHIRHDIVLSMFLLAYFPDGGLKFGSDVPFSKYGVDSRKTPDYIHENEEKIYIIECSVTSSLDKSYLQKGKTKTTSIYKKEISMLQGLSGKEVVWIPLALSSSDRSNNFEESRDLLRDSGLVHYEEVTEELFSLMKEKVSDLRVLDPYGHLVFTEDGEPFNENMKGCAQGVFEVLMRKGFIKEGKRNDLVTAMVNKSVHNYYATRKNQIVETLSCKNENKKYRIVFHSRFIRYPISPDGHKPARWMHWIENDLDVNFFKNSYMDHGYGEVSPLNKGNTVAVSQKISSRFRRVTENTHSHKEPMEPLRLPKTDKEVSYRFSAVDERTDAEEDEMFSKKPEGLDLLADNVVNLATVTAAVDNMSRLQEEADLTIKDNNPKNPFTLPFVEPRQLLVTEERLADTLLFDVISATCPLLKQVQMKYDDGKYKRSVNISDEVSKEFTTSQKEYVRECKDLKLEKIPKPSVCVRESSQPTLVKAAKRLLESIKVLNEEKKKSKKSTEVGVVKPMNKNRLRDFLAKEDPFKWLDRSKSSVIRGIPKESEDRSKEFCSLSMQHLGYQHTFPFPNRILSPGTDTSSMLKLKHVMMTNHKRELDTFNSLNLAHMAEFVGRFCYTLLYESQRKLNGEDFSVSNLGYSNVILVVRGGKKVWEISKSRTYNLTFPCPDYFVEYKDLFSTSSKIFVHEDVTYYNTGWSVVGESVLSDKSFTYFKSCSSFVNYRVRHEEKDDNYTNIFFNFLLMFNNRRSTEVLLSSLRNLKVNMLGTHSSIHQLMKEFVAVPCDAVQRHVLSSLRGLPDYYVGINNDIDLNFREYTTKNIFTGELIKGQQDYTTLLYCTYLMTKAPYNQPVEQAKNLQKMMKTHDQYMKQVGEDSLEEVLDKTNREGWDCFDHEFCVDYKYMVKLGSMCANIIQANEDVTKIHTEWERIMDSPWTDISTPSGMRGSKYIRKGVEGSFFGRKGHEVINQHLMLKTENINSLIEVMDSVDVPEQKKSQIIKELNVSYRDFINELLTLSVEQFILIFHVVDKIQWKGSREVFVMSIFTKALLHPLERFFKRLCMCIENEIISIPSNKRLGIIHSRLFESTHQKDSTKIMLTLDCRRWGPMAMFLKYTLFILGMSPVLPKSMVDLFMVVTILYFKKEIIVSPRCWDIFRKNKSNEEYLQYFEMVEELETAKFKMPYSFVMGIFNYLSSLLHAVNQLDATKNASRRVRDKYDVDILFDMQAHSDDSGGKLEIPQKKELMEVLNLTLTSYEYDLKRANHMLSLKKCVVSKKYFELLSILYMNDELLPLVPKFFSSLELKPTLKGFAADMSAAYSKCIELIGAGATLSEAYFNMRCYSEMVRRFYHLPEYNDRPITAYGGAYAHPIFVLMLGAMSDNARLYKHDKDKFLRYQNAVMFVNDNQHETFQQKGFTPCINSKKSYNTELILNSVNEKYAKVLPIVVSADMPKPITVLTKIESEEESKRKDLTVLVENYNFKNTLLFPVSFWQNCKNNSFIDSLNYQSNTRRLTKLYHTASQAIYNTVVGRRTNKDIANILEILVSGLDNPDEEGYHSFYMKYVEATNIETQDLVNEYLLGEANNVYNFLSNTMVDNVTLEPQKITCKPTNINIDLNPDPLNNDHPLEDIFFSDNQYCYLTQPNKDLTSQKEMIQTKLASLGLPSYDYEDFMFYSRKMTTYQTEFSGFGYTDKNHRHIRDYVDIIKYVETNSLFGCKLTKIYNNCRNVRRNVDFERISTPGVVEKLRLAKLQYIFKNNMELDDYAKVSIKEIKTDYFKVDSCLLKDVDLSKDGNKLVRGLSNDLRLLDKKKVNISEISLAYIWIRRQKKSGINRWAGAAKCLVIMRGMQIILNIRKNMLEDCEIDDPELMTNEDVRMLMALLRKFEIETPRRYSHWEEDYVIGIRNGNFQIARERELDEVYSVIKPLSINYEAKIEHNLWYKRGYSVGAYRSSKHNFTMHLFIADVELSLNMFKDHVIVPHNKSTSSIIKCITDDRPKEIPFEYLLKHLTASSVYKTFIYQLKGNDSIPFLHLLGSVKGFKPLSAKLLHELEDIVIDPDMINDEILTVFADLEFDQLTEENMSHVINDIELCVYEKDWTRFITNWSKAGLEGSLVVQGAKILNSVLKNPRACAEAYPTLAQDALSCIVMTLKDMLNQGLTRKLESDDLGRFRQHGSLKDKHLASFLYMLTFNGSLVNPGNDTWSHFLIRLMEAIFADDGYFSLFKEGIERDSLLRCIPLGMDMAKEWASMAINFSCTKETIYDHYKNFSELFELERDARNFNKKAKSLAILGGRLPLIRKDIDTITRMLPTGDKRVITDTYKFKVSNYHALDRHLLMHVYEAELYDGRSLGELCEDDYEDEFDELSTENKYGWHDGRSCYIENKGELFPDLDKIKKDYVYKHAFDTKKDVEGKIVERLHEVPVYTVVGAASLDQISQVQGRFALRCDSVPKDWNMFPVGLVKIYEDHHNMPNGCWLLVSFNIDGDFERVGYKRIKNSTLRNLGSHSNYERNVYTHKGKTYYRDSELASDKQTLIESEQSVRENLKFGNEELCEEEEDEDLKFEELVRDILQLKKDYNIKESSKKSERSDSESEKNPSSEDERGGSLDSRAVKENLSESLLSLSDGDSEKEPAELSLKGIEEKLLDKLDANWVWLFEHVRELGVSEENGKVRKLQEVCDKMKLDLDVWEIIDKMKIMGEGVREYYLSMLKPKRGFEYILREALLEYAASSKESTKSWINKVDKKLLKSKGKLNVLRGKKSRIRFEKDKASYNPIQDTNMDTELQTIFGVDKDILTNRGFILTKKSKNELLDLLRGMDSRLVGEFLDSGVKAKADKSRGLCNMLYNSVVNSTEADESSTSNRVYGCVKYAYDQMSEYISDIPQPDRLRSLNLPKPEPEMEWFTFRFPTL